MCFYRNFIFQLNIDEDKLIDIIDRPINDLRIDVDRNYLIIEDVKFRINRIRVKGTKKEFKYSKDLLEYLRKRKCNLDLIERKFAKAICDLEKLKKDVRTPPLFEENGEDCLIMEDESSVIVGNTKINKKVAKLPDDRIILIVSNKPATRFKIEFLEDIVSSLKRGRIVRFMTLHLPMSDNPFKIGPILIYNLIPSPSDVLQKLSEFYINKYNELPPLLRGLILVTILDYLSEEVEPLKFFFKQLLKTYLGLLTPNVAYYLENTLIEYKRPDILYGEKDKVIDRLYKAIIKKLRDDIIIFIIGIDGGTRRFCPVDTGKINDDLCREIIHAVGEKLKGDNIRIEEPFFVPVENSGVLLVFYAKKINDNSKILFPSGWQTL